MKKYGANGFTLIEVMITVVVVSLLAAIAYPSYTRFVAETRRSDATINLTRIAAQQEKFFTECGRYADNLVGTPINCPGPGGVTKTLNAGLAAGSTSMEGYYTFGVTVTPGPAPVGGGPGVPGGGGFVLTATPTAGTSQAIADAGKCDAFTLTSTGAKDATGGESPAGTNGGKCWKK
jgi:type IV pilus assembly protein PilE